VRTGSLPARFGANPVRTANVHGSPLLVLAGTVQAFHSWTRSVAAPAGSGGDAVEGGIDWSGA
jgi:hypothetical protein